MAEKAYANKERLWKRTTPASGQDCKRSRRRLKRAARSIRAAAQHNQVAGSGVVLSLLNESKLALPPLACRSIVVRMPRICEGVILTALLNCVTPLLSKTVTVAGRVGH